MWLIFGPHNLTGFSDVIIAAYQLLTNHDVHWSQVQGKAPNSLPAGELTSATFRIKRVFRAPCFKTCDHGSDTPLNTRELYNYRLLHIEHPANYRSTLHHYRLVNIPSLQNRHNSKIERSEIYKLGTFVLLLGRHLIRLNLHGLLRIINLFHELLHVRRTMWKVQNMYYRALSKMFPRRWILDIKTIYS